jgi:hypothetical protein
MKKTYFDHVFVGGEWLLEQACDWSLLFGFILFIGFGLIVSPLLWVIGRFVND